MATGPRQEQADETGDRRSESDAGWFNKLAESSLQGVLVYRDLKPLYANRRLAEMLGCADPGGVLALENVLALFAPGTQSDMQVQLDSVARNPGDRENAVAKMCKADGTLVWVEWASENVTWDDTAAVLLTCVDVTRFKLAESEAQERAQTLRELLEVSNDWYWETDSEHRATDLTLCSGLEDTYDPHKDLGLTRWERSGVMEAKAWQPHIEDLVARRSFRDFRFWRRFRDGSVVHAAISGVPFYGEDGTFHGYRGVTRDVTSEVVAEQQLRERESLLSEILESASDWLWETDVVHRFTFRFPGPSSISQVVGKTRWANAAREDLEANPEKWRQHKDDLANHRPIRDFRYLVGSSAGGTKWVRVSGQPTFDSDGQFTGYRGVATDITAAVQAEERTRAARNQLVAAINTINTPIALFDAHERLVHTNAAYRSLYADDDAFVAPGRHVEDLVRYQLEAKAFPDGIGREESWFANRMRRFREAKQPSEIHHENGEAYLVYDLRLPDGGTLVIRSDITERVMGERALRLAKVTAERASQSKSRFLAAASHDLRQPLQALTLYADILSTYVHASKGQKVIDNIRDNLSGMAGMLDLLLDISEFDSGTIKPNFAAVPINNLLRRLEQEFAIQARADGVIVKFVSCTQAIETDAELLMRVLENFVANAIRYCDRGRVLVGCRRHDDNLMIQVWDTGVGIPQDEQEAIFEEYHQLDNPARDRRKGLGLGLAVAKRVADLLGRAITVRSTLGKGSMFGVSVPLSEVKLETHEGLIETGPVRDVGTLRQKHVILVEDDDRVRAVIEQLLDDDGARVHSFASAAQVPSNLAAESWRPALAIADFRLGEGVTGADVIRGIRRDLGTRVPAIILTGDTGSEPERAAQDLGCELLHKPVDGALLTATMVRAITHRQQTNKF